MKNNSYNVFFSNFSNKTRIKIISLLEENPSSVGRISKKINEEQSKVSHHLKKLKQCNIVEVEIKGKERIYSLNKKTVIPLLNIVKKHTKTECCSNCMNKCSI
jgi:ArsR family transcriptional regulator, zinc-responsive transcriptional repressor